MHGRRLVILIAGNFFVATSFMSVSGLLREIAASLHISIAAAGSLIAVFALTAGLCAPVLATFGSRIDRRLLLTTSLAICGIANLLAAFSQSYGQLLACRILAAVTSAVYTPQVAATVSMLVNEKERGPILGKLMMGWAIGAVIGGPLTVFIGSTYDWRIAMAVIAIGGGAIAFLVWHAVPVGVRVPALNLPRWLQIARSPALRLLTLTTAFNAVGNHLVFSYLSPTMFVLHGVTGSLLSALYFVNGLGGVAGSIGSVMLIQRMGAAHVAYLCTMMVAVVLVFWPLGAAVLAIVFVLQFFWSAGSSGLPSVQQTRLVGVAPVLASATIALNSSVGYLGNSIGTFLGGHAWNWVGPRYLPWLGAVFIFVSIACSVLGERAARREPAFDVA